MPAHRIESALWRLRVLGRPVWHRLRWAGRWADRLARDFVFRKAPLSPAQSHAPTLRIGCFAHSTKCYSGGRIHIFQLLWTLASQGAEVFLLTDREPRWAGDYPFLPNLHILAGPGHRPPEDLDLLLTDGKDVDAMAAFRWKRRRPHLPLVGFNFETPNWVSRYFPRSAALAVGARPLFRHANLILCISEESRRWFERFTDAPIPTAILPPAANDLALTVPAENPLPPEARRIPYVAWAGQASAHKGFDDLCRAVLAIDAPLNVAVVGHRRTTPPDTVRHRFIRFSSPLSDAQKLSVFRGASCVAAPSLFEGYGMVPAEALICGRPVVVYDLPVLRQVYGDRLIYAEWGDVADFSRKLAATVLQPPAVDAAEARQSFGMASMAARLEGAPYFHFRRRKISAQMIVYHGPLVREAIACVYPHVDELLIAYGPTTCWKHIPPDSARELILSFPDPGRKIRFCEKPRWNDLREMRQACQRMMTGNFLLLVEADEIWHRLDQWISQAPDYGCPRWVCLHRDKDHFVVDTPGLERWGLPHESGGSVAPLLRWARWRYSYQWADPWGTMAHDANGNALGSLAFSTDAVTACPECCIYRFGNLLSTPPERKTPPMTRTLDRRHDHAPEGAQVGRHPEGNGGGEIRRVTWELPPLAQEAWRRVEAARPAEAPVAGD